MKDSLSGLYHEKKSYSIKKSKEDQLQSKTVTLIDSLCIVPYLWAGRGWMKILVQMDLVVISTDWGKEVYLST